MFEVFESRTPPSLHINTRINSDRKLKASADICDSPSWQKSFQQGENTVSPSAASTGSAGSLWVLWLHNKIGEQTVFLVFWEGG